MIRAPRRFVWVDGAGNLYFTRSDGLLVYAVSKVIGVYQSTDDGHSWNNPFSTGLSSIAGTSVNDIFAVGATCTIAHYH